MLQSLLVSFVLLFSSTSFGQNFSESSVDKDFYTISSVEVREVEDEESFKKEIREQYANQGHTYYATGRLWDDGILDPLETRRVLGLVLSLQATEHATDSNYGVFRM